MSGWKDIVRSIAPTLGAALGGPMAGAATKFIADKVLGNPEATSHEIEDLILGASPEMLAKLKEMDNQFKVDMRKLDIDVYEMEYKDRDSARQLFSINIWPQIILSSIFVFGYFIILIALFFNSDAIPSENSALLGVFTTVLGVLTAAIPQILNFWFGSSLGSKQKTHGMAQAAAKNGSVS